MERPPLEAIAQQIEQRYLFQNQAQPIAEALRKTTFVASSELDLAEQITEMLIQKSGDKHFFLRYRPELFTEQTDHDAVMKAHGEQARLRNYGFQALEILSGNVGYWHLTELAPPNLISDLLKAAISFLARVHALILDLRDNHGGMPETVQLLASQFLVPEAMLSGIESREGGYQESSTLANAQHFLDIPLYILIDGETFSAGEALVYDLQAHRRAVVLGTRSKGGAHLSSFIPLEGKWLLRLPIARALNPITNSNWEKHGVAPDIETTNPKEEAQRMALEHLIRLNPDSSHHLLWSSALKSLNGVVG